MANETIFDLTQETSLNPGDRFAVQQTSAATRTTSATFALMGGLVPNVISTDANVTGAVGQLDVWDISGLTASRDHVLPASANVGECCGVMLSTGDATYEVALKSGATGDLINGTDRSATGWTEIFITGEIVIYMCVSATNPDWIVLYDGRIPSRGRLDSLSSAQSLTQEAFTELDYSNSAYSVGTVNTTGASASIKLRRAGQYQVGASWTYNSVPADQAKSYVRVFDGTNPIAALNFYTANNHQSHTSACHGLVDIAADTTIEGGAYTSEASATVATDNYRTFLYAHEVLTPA